MMWYAAPMGDTTSQLRQQLRRAADQYADLLAALLGEQGPLIRGTFRRVRRKCGRGNCRCTRGELHDSTYLAATVNGMTRQVYVPAKDEVEVAEDSERYRRFRKRRQRLGELARRHLELVDELGISLLKPYPPDNPVPPPQRRGRKPRKDDG